MDSKAHLRNIRETKYTKVVCIDKPGAGNACHMYRVINGYDNLANVSFQNGPIQENGVNGVQNEDLLAIVIDRLEGFQAGNYACRENALALTKIQEALLWLEKRTADRVARNVEGKSEL